MMVLCSVETSVSDHLSSLEERMAEALQQAVAGCPLPRDIEVLKPLSSLVPVPKRCLTVLDNKLQERWFRRNQLIGKSLDNPERADDENVAMLRFNESNM